jgi:Helix-turn-helix family
MTPEQAAHDTAAIVVATPAGFIQDPATFARGAELGFEGTDFYVAGRGGVLGEVPADVVTAAFWVFAPDAIRAAWDRSASVMSRHQAAEEWLACAHAWARAHFADGPDHARAAALLGIVVQHAAVAGAPVFAGLRTFPEPEPDDAKALLQHRLNAVRELRGALHGAAVLTVGLRPVEAMVVRAPELAGIFGWTEPFPEPEPLHERWALAEARTDRMLGRHLALLPESERIELVEILQSVANSLT